MKKYIMILMMMAMPSYAMAAAEVKVAITAKKVVMVEKDGVTVEKFVEADSVLPDDVLVYALSFENKGDEPANNVELNDPIPEGTVYIVDSAFGPSAKISFSIDGKTFKKASLLTYTVEQNGQKDSRKASPEQYRFIRWLVETVPAGKSGVVGFRVRVQ